MAVLFFITIATAIVIIVILVSEKCLGEAKENIVLTYLYFGLETVCNQIGNKELRNISFRIISLSLRVIAMFLWTSFGAILTSFLSVKFPKPPFSNVTDFRHRDQYQLIGEHNQIQYIQRGSKV